MSLPRTLTVNIDHSVTVFTQGQLHSERDWHSAIADGSSMAGVDLASGEAQGRALLKPQSYVELHFDEPSVGERRGLLHNTLTGEVVSLSPNMSTSWELEVDETSGLAVVYGDGEYSRWASDFFSFNIFVEDGRHIVCEGGSQKYDITALRDRHEVGEATLSFSLEGLSVPVKVAVFTLTQEAGRMWICVSDMWNKYNLNCCPGTGAKWFQARAARWRKFATLFELGADSVRCSVPYNKACDSRPDGGGGRCLSFSSIHVSVLLLQAVNGVFAPARQSGRVSDTNMRAMFESMIRTLTMIVKPGQCFELRLGTDVAKVSGVPCGSHPGKVQRVSQNPRP